MNYSITGKRNINNTTQSCILHYPDTLTSETQPFLLETMNFLNGLDSISWVGDHEFRAWELSCYPAYSATESGSNLGSKVDWFFVCKALNQADATITKKLTFALKDVPNTKNDFMIEYTQAVLSFGLTVGSYIVESAIAELHD